ncbi:MAG: NAD(P)/FAD-dependent oxidoreductase [Halobacteriales archaeon]
MTSKHISSGPLSEEIEHRELIIAGAGIAGLSAAIYSSRAKNDPLVIEGPEPGGQLTLTTEVENYPGFPDAITGPELITRMKTQAIKFGAETRYGTITTIDDTTHPFKVGLSDGTFLTSDAFIVASGASARTLGVSGEDELMGYGVSTCATCDGAFFKDEDMLVVGGGDAAMEEAHFLTKFANKVYIAHRRDSFRAEKYWIDRIMKKVESGNISILWNTEVSQINGTPDEGISTIDLIHHADGNPSSRKNEPGFENSTLNVGALFIAIGHIPNTDYLRPTSVELDSEGYLLTQGGSGSGKTHTAVPGIFGAGDVVDSHYQQAITAGSMGVQAALDAGAYLDDLLDR